MKIGIFGKSGSGKTTVAAFFKEKGFFVADLDIIGRSCVDIYPDIRKDIEEEFGKEYLTDDGIDRKELAKKVFSSEKEMEKLDLIFFPYIKKEALKLLRSHKNIIIEGAVLADIGLTDLMDIVIYVKTPRENSLSRIVKREGITKKQISDRLDKQSHYDVQGMTAEYIIVTDSGVKELYERLESLYKNIKKLI